MSLQTCTTLQQNLIPISDKEMKLFQNFIYEQAGIKMGPQKKSLIQNRLRKRLLELDLESYEAYYRHLTDPAHKTEIQHCLNALTTNETYFFRHKNHWDYLIQTIVPEWKHRNHTNDTFRFWSAAGSSGEEPYSAAIALHSLLAHENINFSVEATDINEEVIQKAKLGIYNSYSVQKLTSLCIKKYFFHNKTNQTYQLRNEIKNHVKYTRHNLLSHKPGPKFDIVFLRNVMIYFDDNSKATVIQNITEKIKKNGYLILGGAEALTSCREQYDYIKPTIFRKIKT